jgi:N-acetylneuraminic acid mutarotase
MALPGFPRFDRFARSFIPLLPAIAAIASSPSAARAQDLAAAPDSWTATSTVGAPSARVNHTAVWTGEKMIVWGGDTAQMSTDPTLGNGGLYDPQTNSWSAVATAGAPAPREFATAVWTGSEMIVWGGIRFGPSGPVAFNSGGIYDPRTNSWKAMSAFGAPSVRSSHTAVWTGSEMIVWGGETNSFDFAAPHLLGDAATDEQAVIDPGLLNSGGIYDPVSDTWRPMSTVNAPSPRAEHKAVWTGSRMIVWGGDDAHSNIAGGGIYDPVTDTWIRTSSVGEPAARDVHTAVWTGSRMVVWGGIGVMDPLRTGGVFDPVANSWEPTNLTGSPSARGFHTAVDLRGRMIVWGGNTAGQPVNTGGIYDPVADAWTTTAISGAPAGRSRATAVSTGTAMIVWGGYDGSRAVNSGGVYTPPEIPCPTERGCVFAISGPDAAVVGRRP